MRWFVCLLAALLSLSGCTRIDPPEELGELVVGVRKASTLFAPKTPDSRDAGDTTGFDHDLIEAFGTALGLKVRYVTAADPAALLKLLRDGKVHFVASLPVVTEEAAGLLLSPPIRAAKPLLVRHIDALSPSSLDDLPGRTVEVIAGTPQAASLQSLPEGGRPLVTERRDIDSVALLERVANRSSELAAADSDSFQVAVNFFPDLAVASELPGEIKFAWGFADKGDRALYERARGFIEHITRDGTLARVHDRYFGHISRVAALDIAKFLERRVTLLPSYRREFVAAQEVTGIDWRLLAALAYQESHWDPLATSPTGVRGMMMLTEDTADQLRVTNRLDASQSIQAGSRYLADLIAQLPISVDEPDRTWLALAAYNLGMGHLNGARYFAGVLKRDPDSWYDMKQVLPLLARPEYYSRLKSGRARGGEAVILVENVRTYFDVLSRFEPPLKFTLIPPFKRQ
ncbi:MAG: membrane-bound lytic murein transglycosylase MltF [Gammaproteobacteria bacterium]|nr:membrane-bound lytic murein transglycosylase MltF [Gammaproteobacteria bacterium]MBU1646118.1 membrane-bound lytic murein transglycosylase MltF [Gammaproteobacteria bacterium]MBU1972180.1 membrane-bound lytic murein transglycosylase MltF [Gammaproteobacteria bacterium]